MHSATTNPSAWLLLQRTVRFGDTDAAGVMHFHQLFRWCHEAYEESLERFGIPAAAVFPTPSWFVPASERDNPATPEANHQANIAVPGASPGSSGDTADKPAAAAPRVALPIVHCHADFRRPLVCGDGLTIQLRPKWVAPDCFEIAYSFLKPDPDGADWEIATALTRHRAIDASQRTRCGLPEPIACWLRSSAAGSAP